MVGTVIRPEAGSADEPVRIDNAQRTRVRRVVLAHHKPDRTDEAFDRLADRFGADPRVTVAAEGAVLTY